MFLDLHQLEDIIYFAWRQIVHSFYYSSDLQQDVGFISLSALSDTSGYWRYSVLLKVHMDYCERDFVHHGSIYVYFGFVLQWVLVVKCFCFQPRLTPALFNSFLQSHWVFQHLLSACVSRWSEAGGKLFCLPTAHLRLMNSMCGKRKTVVCPCIFSLVKMEYFSICLPSLSSRPTCASPGTGWVRHLGGWTSQFVPDL